MGAELDELRVRQMLDAVTADQPTAPPYRYDAIKRRFVRRRRNLVAGTLVLVAAVAIPAIGISSSLGRSPAASGSRPVPGWALPWPDHRNGSVPQRVLDEAVLAWRHQAAPADGSWQETAPQHVVWYVGQTVAHGQDVAVIFEVSTPIGHELVSGFTDAASVMHGQPAWSHGASPWIIYSVPAPPPRTAPRAIGLNVPTRGRDNWVVELTAPAIRTLVLQIPHVTSESLATYGTGGLFVRDIGRQLTGPVQVSPQVNQIGGRVWFRNAVPVGLPGSPASQAPQLALPAPLTGSSGSLLIEVDGQGGVPYGWSGDPTPARAIVARCYGTGSLVITINDQFRRPAGTIRCDDRQHELSFGSRPRRVTSLFVTTSWLTSFRVALTRR